VAVHKLLDFAYRAPGVQCDDQLRHGDQHARDSNTKCDDKRCHLLGRHGSRTSSVIVAVTPGCSV
jgi:hypothetical protein